MNKRISQVNSLLKSELAQIINRKFEPPPDCLITLTAVETTPDLHEARVWISVLPESQANRIFKMLNRQKNALQTILHQKLVMKPLPKLEFKIDQTEANATRLERILDNLK